MRRTASLVLAGALIAVTGSTGTMQSPANPYARDAKQAVDEAYTKKLKEYTTETVLHLAARRLPAGVEDRADAAGGARRHRRRARQAALLARGLPVHADGREGEPAGEGLLDRQDRRRPRDDRGGGLVGGESREARREPRAPRQARRPAHDRAERRRGRQAGRPVGAGLLHHRHHPLARDRLAHRADGTGLPAGRRREPVHPEDPQPDRHARSPRSSKSTAAIARSTSTAGTWPTPARTGRRSSTGASTSPTTTTATRWP